MKITKFPILLMMFSLSIFAAPQMCFDQAGRDYQIDPLLLMAISIKESRLKASAVNGSNNDGSEDICGMQVNSYHYSKLKTFNITRDRLLKDPCICVYSGAWVLAHNFQSYGKNWDSVGMYNTGPRDVMIKKRRAYATEIKNIYRILLARKTILEQSSEPPSVSAARKSEEIVINKN